MSKVLNKARGKKYTPVGCVFAKLTLFILFIFFKICGKGKVLP